MMAEMGAPAGGEATRAERMTIRACFALAFAVTVIGLGCMMIIPVSPPDPAMSARVAGWRALTPASRPAKIP
jgi:hypothetical protein